MNLSPESLCFASIDIGSNAVRLLIKSVNTKDVDDTFVKLLMVRVPLRLGQESFVTGKISEPKAKKLVKLMKAFKHLMKVYDVVDYRACATSAMRDAKNAKDLVKEIRKETDINVEIIEGQEEASIIYESHFADSLNSKLNYIYVDVGGGSTEVTLLVKGELVQSKSYNIGTVRLLNDKVESIEYDTLHKDLSLLKDTYKINDIIGSGGNIIKLYALAHLPKNNKISLQNLENIHETMKKLTVEELISKYKLKADRADVIVHAAAIYIDVAKSIGAESFIVPTIGLNDGIIHMLYAKWKEKNSIAENGIWL